MKIIHRHTRSEATLLYGIDVLEGLKQLPDGSVQLICTSPPYFGLKDYALKGGAQVGREDLWPDYVQRLVEVFKEARRVLRSDGVVFLNIGDTYHNYRGGKGGLVVPETIHKGRAHDLPIAGGAGHRQHRQPGLKEKDQMMIPWRVALALQADGWHIRNTITWVKTHHKPESVKDRFSRGTEPIFMLTKSKHYFFDKSALPEGFRRDVWEVNPAKGGRGHFAAWPAKLVFPMVLGASREGDTVLDVFSGTGTTGRVALRNRRNYIGIDLMSDYLNVAVDKLEGETSQSVPVTGAKTGIEELWG